MSKNGRNGEGLGRKLLALAILSALTVMSPVVTHAQKKSKADQKAETEAKIKAIDYSNIVWPNPPAIARIKFKAWYANDKEDAKSEGGKAERNQLGWTAWRGRSPTKKCLQCPFRWCSPTEWRWIRRAIYMSRTRKVGAIFIFTTDKETKDVELIKNSVHAHFVRESSDWRWTIMTGCLFPIPGFGMC